MQLYLIDDCDLSCVYGFVPVVYFPDTIVSISKCFVWGFHMVFICFIHVFIYTPFCIISPYLYSDHVMYNMYVVPFPLL